MKIAIFTDTYYPQINGVTSSVERQIDALQSHNVDFRLFGPATTSVPIPIKSLTLLRTKDKRYGLDIPVTRSAGLASGWTPDVVHIHTPFAFGLLGARYARMTNAKILYTHHTNLDAYLHYVKFLNNQIGRMITKGYINWLIRKVDKVIAPSRHCADSLIAAGVPACDVVVLPTPLDAVYGRNRETNDRVYDLLFVGRLAKEKNIDLLISVITTMSEQREGTTVAIVGDGLAKGRLLSWIKDCRLRGVRLLGELGKHELVRVYRQSKLLFAPSTTETQGLVFQEAMSQGVPIVATSCEQTREFVRHGYNGILLPAETATMASAISALLDDWDRYEQMSRACADSVREFSSQNWLTQYSAVISWATARNEIDFAAALGTLP